MGRLAPSLATRNNGADIKVRIDNIVCPENAPFLFGGASLKGIVTEGGVGRDGGLLPDVVVRKSTAVL